MNNLPIIASVYDSKVGSWSFPQQFVNKGHLVRSWETACNQPDSPFYLHPQDFTMFVVGEWDDQKGAIAMYKAKESVGTALEFKKTNPVHVHQTALVEQKEMQQ